MPTNQQTQGSDRGGMPSLQAGTPTAERSVALEAPAFRSILFDDAIPVHEAAVPAVFRDLYLDQVVESITAGREEYDLKPFFYARLTTLDAIIYRQEILRDLEGPELFSCVEAFAERMRQMRRHLARVGSAYYGEEKKAWFLDAAKTYCDAVSRLVDDLARVEPQSRGFRAFREYLANYAQSNDFATLRADTVSVKEALASVRYCVNIKGGRVRVSRYESEPDYSAEVERTFEKFKQSDAKSYLATFSDSLELNHVEARILSLVARLYPEEFSALDDYCDRHRSFVLESIEVFDREVQFYVAYLEYVKRLEAAGLSFCYPEISDRSKDVCAVDAFDIALANKLALERATVVCNDLCLMGQERIVVVSGPNNGGKTTFARMFGQLHYLAGLGCLVPAKEAQLYLVDQLFTHFEREEDISNPSGKLQDDLVRVHEILERATSDSIVIMNETFTSTTLQDALVLGTTVMTRMMELDLLCVYVTFVDELASLGPTIVSMVSTVVPEDPAGRTFKLVRRPADGLAYATAIAEKHGLTYARLKDRLAS